MNHNVSPLDREKQARIELYSFLARRRHLLAALYFFAVTTLVVSIYLYTPLVIPDALSSAIRMLFYAEFADLPFRGIENEGGMGEGKLVFVVLVVAVFFLLQALFIWGGGRVRISESNVPLFRRLLPLVIFSLIMSMLIVGVLVSFLEFSDRTYSAGSVRAELVGDEREAFLGNDDFKTIIVYIFSFSWFFWFVLAFLLFTKNSHLGWLTRLVKIIFVCSWIEFMLALAVEVAVRPRSDECPCATGSYLTLIFVVPVMLWSIGPALYFLYLREKNMTLQHPGHARRILARKSKRDDNMGEI